MCKHVAAALYGVGARLDQMPQLLFVLRGVDENELLAGVGQDLAVPKLASGANAVLDAGDVAALFGIDMAEAAPAEIPVPAISKPARRIKAANKGKANEGKAAAAPKSNAVLRAYSAARSDATETAREPVPLHLRNAATPLMKNLGYGKEYRYVHNDARAKEEMSCLPEKLKDKIYFEDDQTTEDTE